MASVGAKGLQGALGGMGTGASLGTALLPGVGTILGALGGSIIGAISGAGKAKAVNDAMASLEAIPSVDPNQLEFKDQLYKEKRAVESGFSTDFQVARDLIGQSEAGGMSVASELAQTNPALALMMMQQVGQGADTAVNKALGTISTRGMGYTQMIGDLINQMAQRKLDVNLFKTQVELGQSTKEMQDFNANSLAGMMKLADPANIAGIKGLFNKNSLGSIGLGGLNPATLGNIDVNNTTLNPVA